MTSIKVNRIKLIQSLEAALKKAEKEIVLCKKSREKANKQYESDLAKWEKEWASWQNRYINLIPNSKVQFIPPNNYAIPHELRAWGVIIKHVQKFGDIQMNAELNSYVLEKDLPQKPEKPFYGFYSCETRAEEIKKLLKLLNMSDEEKVSTSSYKNVAAYL
jgi:hypothetical protein